MTECLFCKIIAAEIPSYRIYEDAQTYAFLDIHPNNMGQTLVIPKNHYKNLFDTPEATLASMISTAKRIASIMETTLKAEGVNLIMNNDRAAGQVIEHAHLHVIPRFLSDGLTHWPGKTHTDAEMREVAEKMRGALTS